MTLAHQTHHIVRRGFTYIELVTSLAVSSILLLGLSSVILIGSRAVPTGTEQIHTEASVSNALEMIASDLELATEINSLGAKVFVVVVPDRDGDGTAESITYKCNADTGEITKRWNLDAEQTFIENVESFSFSFTTDSGKASYVKLQIEISGLAMPAQVVEVDLFNNPEVR